MRLIRRALPSILAAVALAGTASVCAQAATGRAAGLPAVNHSGTYNGQIAQVLPQAYTGHIHFIVRSGKITAVRFTAGALCGAVWVVDQDHALPSFPVNVTSSGAFSYQGTVAGRQIQLNGRLDGNRAYGTFFQTFAWGQTTCTMGQVAWFTATR